MSSGSRKAQTCSDAAAEGESRSTAWKASSLVATVAAYPTARPRDRISVVRARNSCRYRLSVIPGDSATKAPAC